MKQSFNKSNSIKFKLYCIKVSSKGIQISFHTPDIYINYREAFIRII